jgi:plastocyanin
MQRRSVFVFLAILLFVSIFPVSVFVPSVEAQGEAWLEGWQYRKSHVVNPASGAGTNYQVRIKVEWGELAEEDLLTFSQVVSTLPVPSGASVNSAQAAAYWDGIYLHVWYAASTSGEINDTIYYTKVSSPFTNWDTPVLVIDREDGIRDPTIFIEDENIYFFCQCFDGNTFRPIRLYKISKTSNFSNPGNYVYVGVVIDADVGTYDAQMVASPCVVKTGDSYYLMYEALSNESFSIGRAKSTSIESLPWTKDGQLRATNGNVVRNPTDSTRAIVPDTFVDQDTLFFHYYDGIYWNVRYINGDFANNSVTLGGADIDPDDGYLYHHAITHIGVINGSYYFLMQSDWLPRLYKVPRLAGSLEQHSRTDFGDVRFTASDGGTLLDYWIEERVDGDYAVFWVKVEDNLSSSPATIYIYYGRSDATTTSNGANTFPTFFDDCSSLDNWQTTAGAGCTVTVYEGRIRQSLAANAEWRQADVISKIAYGPYNRLLTRTKLVSGKANVWQIYGYTDRAEQQDVAFGWWETNFWLFGRKDGVEGHHVVTGPDTDYHTWMTAWSNGRIRYYKDYAQQSVDKTDLVPTTAMKIGCQLQGGTTENIINYVDWMAVAKYVYPEPAHGAWGNEETAEPPVASFTYSPAQPKASEPILFNASLSTPNGGTITDYEWSFGDGNIASTSNPTITHTYNTSGTYNTTLTISDSEGMSASTWNTVTVSSRNQTMISISAFASSKFVGFNVEINGTLADAEGNGLSGAIVVLSHTFPGISEWIPLTSATTDTLGNYDFTWIPPLTGQFTIRTEWAGNDTYAPASNSSTLNVIPYGSMYIFSVASNSTVSALTFNSTSLELGFNATGPSGTTGFARVITAKTLVANTTDLKVYLDGSPLEYSTNSTTDSWIIEFTYGHSTHQIVIALNSMTETTPTAYPTTPMLLALLIATLILATLLKKKKPHTYITHQKHANSQDQTKLLFTR